MLCPMVRWKPNQRTTGPELVYTLVKRPRKSVCGRLGSVGKTVFLAVDKEDMKVWTWRADRLWAEREAASECLYLVFEANGSRQVIRNFLQREPKAQTRDFLSLLPSLPHPFCNCLPFQDLKFQSG